MYVCIYSYAGEHDIMSMCQHISRRSWLIYFATLTDNWFDRFTSTSCITIQTILIMLLYVTCYVGNWIHWYICIAAMTYNNVINTLFKPNKWAYAEYVYCMNANATYDQIHGNTRSWQTHRLLYKYPHHTGTTTMEISMCPWKMAIA
jgi:hypothetical protein